MFGKTTHTPRPSTPPHKCSVMYDPIMGIDCPSTPPHTCSVMYDPIMGIEHSPLGRNCRVDSSKTRACARLLQAGFEPRPTCQSQLCAASYASTMLY